MSSLSFRHGVAGLLISLLLLALVSCGAGSSNLDGVYHGMPGSPITITLKSGKAIVQVANESKTRWITKSKATSSQSLTMMTAPSTANSE